MHPDICCQVLHWADFIVLYLGIEYSQDGLMVLKATGEPLCEYHPDKRMALTNQVWEYIKSSGK